MDLVSIAFLILMVAVGGFVAWLGDNLGRTIGKKRLTFLHLRPRHTATLFTVGAGCLIPFLTVVFVSIVSSDVRQWLAEGRQAIAQRDAAFKERDEADAERQRTVQDNERQRGVNERLTSQGKQQQEQIRKQAESLRTQVATTQRLAADAKRLSAQVNRSAADLARATARLGTTQRDLTTASGNLRTVQTRWNELNTSYQEMDTQFRELIARNRDLDQQNSRLETDSARLTDDLATNREALGRLQAEQRNTERSLETTRLNLDEARSELERAGSWLSAMQQMLNRNLDNSRRNPMLFSMGQEMARMAIPARAEPPTARTLVSAVLSQANDLAIGRGARQPEGAGLFERFDRQNGAVRSISVEEQVASLVDRAAGKGEDQVLVAYSALNAFQGEFVALEMRLFPNARVYARGQVIAEGRIDGNQDEPAIMRQVSDFLRLSLRPKAVKDRMIPVSGRDDGLAPVSQEELFSLARVIKEQDRIVRLVAHARQDTRSGDVLLVDFRVR